MNILIQTILIYLGVFFLSFFFFNILSKGYLFTFIKVKGSRGKKILINVKPKVGSFYPVIGRLEGEFIVYNDRESKAGKQKTPKRVPVSNDDFGLLYGCLCINVDESSSSIFKPTGEIVSVDIIKFNNLYERALYKPSAEANDKIITIILLILAIITLLACVVLFTKIGQLQKAVSALGQVGRVVGANV